MLMSPSKFPLGKILKNRTINFETVNRIYGNLVFIGTDDEDTYYTVLGSKLFRPQQMMSSFTPRIIRPLDRKNQRNDQKTVYEETMKRSGGKIKIGKLLLTAYNGRNLIYNIIPEYSETIALGESIKGQTKQLQITMTNYFEKLISSRIEEINYEKNFLVFPFVKYIENFKPKVFTKIDVADPLILFLKSIRLGTIDWSKYEKIERIFFYNPNSETMIVINPAEFDEKKFNDLFLKIQRLNNFNSGQDTFDDVEDDDDDITEDDKLENLKEDIKNIVLRRFAVKLKADNLTDFEAASKDEQNLILSIEKKIQQYLLIKTNLDKPFEELVTMVENDIDVRLKALKLVETKKIAQQKLLQLSRNLQREVEVVNSIDELIPSENTTLDVEKFDIPDIDKRMTRSSISNMDEEYNKKQAATDLKAILTSFSDSEFLPLTVQDLKITDSSDDFNQTLNVAVRYKTDEGGTLSFNIDIPKIVDKRYFFLGGNKKTLTKQLFRLPIVKTKADRVEITTNYNKITIERTKGKISRRNFYLLKLLKEYKNNRLFKIEYGSNGIINSEYKNDFEYEELSDSILSIESPRYKVIFNRKIMEQEISLLALPNNYVTDKMTPFAFDKLSGALIYIKDDGEVYQVATSGATPKEEVISSSLFNFLYLRVLEQPATGKLPQIGKSFVYTNIRILGTTYPLFSVVAFLNGMTDILKRYRIEHKVSKKKLPQSPDWVEIRFKDVYFYYKDTVKNTLLLNVLYLMQPEQYDLSDFDLDQPYLDFFINKLDQPVYIKNTLRINTNIMLDPITKDILKDLRAPSNIIDLLLQANTMLINNSYRPQNDIRNYRVRGIEIVYAKLYEIIAEAYMKYQRARLNGRTVGNFEIPRNILISRLLMEPNVNDHSTLNPVLELEKIAEISAKGHRGINLDSAYTLEVRAYDTSMVGFISPNSTPQGNAGVSRTLTYNPQITSVRGYITDVDRDKLDAESLLSPAELLSPFTSTQAD